MICFVAIVCAYCIYIYGRAKILEFLYLSFSPTQLFFPLNFITLFVLLFLSLIFCLSLPLTSLCTECEPHSGPGLGIRSPEADTEEGGGDQGSRPL